MLHSDSIVVCCVSVRVLSCVVVILCLSFFFFFNQKTAYELRISDWSSDVCSSDLVETGLLESDARKLNRGFVSRMTRGRPWLTLKLAASLDGRTAMASGESQWITGANARADVHRLRAAAGCVMTGGATVLADDPQLTVRLPADDSSDERRVGKECVRTCRSLWSPLH